MIKPLINICMDSSYLTHYLDEQLIISGSLIQKKDFERFLTLLMIFNRPGVAGAVLRTPPSLID